ncbi:hypothetical protein QAD02_004059 [Eretmocerus hayati]|uniref:Uncharacterized protein n=1 Tax=Eretmocerus hayati TaxID=131215 RepID=A0ACC2NR59_9HYME|nr:hypothetical protein QAD02_004059 [Eretmocerus hayati]
MELKEPKKKKQTPHEFKSSLPLVFGSKGELTTFHANLTALGSCVADPSEMEIIYKMGYFGKGSLSKSHPKFGRVRFGAPPIIRNRQWQRRQEWIREVQKLSIDTFFEDDKNENDQSKNDDKTSEHNESFEQAEGDDLNTSIDSKEAAINDQIDTSQLEPEKDEICTKKDLPSASNGQSRDIEILDSGKIVGKTNGQSDLMEVDEVVLDSTEEEDVSEISTDNLPLNSGLNDDLLFQDEQMPNPSEYNKNDPSIQGKVLVLPDSDSDTENYLDNIKPEVRPLNFPVRETLHLTFEETFFLMYGLGCLRVIDFDGKYLSIGETWDYFCKEQRYFLQKYVTYHYFRSKGWVVKPGLKYGGDYLLYKEGPPYYHSSYVVIIDVLDAVTFKRIESKALRNMTWNKFVGLERLAESVGKEILFAQILWPSSLPQDANPPSPDILSHFTLREVLWRRWKLSQDSHLTNVVDDDDEDEYSS